MLALMDAGLIENECQKTRDVVVENKAAAPFGHGMGNGLAAHLQFVRERTDENVSGQKRDGGADEEHGHEHGEKQFLPDAHEGETGEGFFAETHCVSPFFSLRLSQSEKGMNRPWSRRVK